LSGWTGRLGSRLGHRHTSDQQQSGNCETRLHSIVLSSAEDLYSSMRTN
jgi:hypothetical protein